MKKAIFIILFALPVFLMVTISVAGRLIILYKHIPVESVHFVNEEGVKITSFKVGLGQKAKIMAVITPEEATNKNVSYMANVDSDSPEFSYNEETNELEGLRYGTARLRVITEDENLSAEILVTVKDEAVTGVALNKSQHQLRIGEEFKLTATVLPLSALNRTVTWASSDSLKVKVATDGTITALAATEPDLPIIITATTQEGGFSATCAITVLDELPEIAFVRIGEQIPVASDENIIVKTNEIDLMNYVHFDNTIISSDEIVFKVNGIALNGSTLTFSESNQAFVVSAHVSQNEQEVYNCFATFRYVP